MKRRQAAPWLALIAVALAAGMPPAAQDPVLFEEATSGILELAGQSRVRVEGFAGTVFVRAGKQGELRYSAVARTTRREAHPVALWLRGGTIIFRPVAGLEADELILEIALSDGLPVEIEKNGGKVQVSTVSDDVFVRAVDSEVDIRGAQGAVTVELERGTLRLENLGLRADVSASGLESAELVRLTGGARLELSECAAKAESVGPLELDLDRSTIEVSGATGGISGSALEGRVSLDNVRAGGALRLEEAPLELLRSRGAFDIETDAAVTFRDLAGSLTVKGFGGSVNGSGHAGEVRIENRDASVSLTNIAGPVVLLGEALDVTLTQLRNTVTAELVGSEFRAEGLKGALDLKNEFGDVTVKGFEGAAKIANRNGNVHLLDVRGTAEIDAEGPEVRVGWQSIGRERDSRIENAAGDLYVSFPNGQGARVDAEADSIETDLEALRITDDGRHANGLLENAESPVVTLRASGLLVVNAAP